VHTERFDLKKGKTKFLLGSEVMLENKFLDCVYGIVTDYHEWTFYKSCPERVEFWKEKRRLSTDAPPDVESLRPLVGMIRAMLSDQ
jgi:hypothetical protein